MNVTDILVPKTKDEIIAVLFDDNITRKERDADTVMNLHKMIPIIKTDGFNPMYCVSSLILCNETQKAERIEHSMPTVTFIPTAYKIFIKNKIDIEKIYLETIDLIINNSSRLNLFDEMREIKNQIRIASNTIVMNLHGPATFYMMNEKTCKIMGDLFGFMTFKPIIENYIPDNKIIVGRNNGKSNQGIYLFLHKNKYSLDVLGNVNNLYICIDIC